MSSKSGTTKHYWHGGLFILAGIYMLGSYVSVGESLGDRSTNWGPMAAIGLMVVGLLFFWRGDRFLAGREIAVEYYEAMVMAVGFALLVRTFVIEPFKIPSGSMIPTLLVGDYLFVSKLAYGHRIPFSGGRLFMGDGPKRGDIAVFEYPRDPSKDYIKRIIGLPGDRIIYQDKRLYINDKPVMYEENGLYEYVNELGQKVESAQFIEQLPGVAHPILIRPFSYSDQITDVVVPPGHYFAIGDNRDNSNDSRYWGFVPAHRLVGRAVILFWSWDSQSSSLRWKRIGNPVQ